MCHSIGHVIVTSYLLWLHLLWLYLLLWSLARDRNVEQRVVEGRAERQQGVDQQQEVAEQMQPQPTGRDLGRGVVRGYSKGV